MVIEQQRESSPKFKEVEWVTRQVKEELKRFNKEKFYEKNGDEITYNMDTVKQYLGVLKDKKTWKELISKNSSAMVMAVQIALYSQNYSFGSIDGILGTRTKEAIKKFQVDNNLPVDIYGRSMPSTIQKLLEIISKEDQVEIPEEEKEEAEEIMEEKENKSEDNYLKEENEEGLNQNIIRSEVQELINSPTRNSEKFKELTSITYAEAVAISEMGGYFIELSGIKSIKQEIFEVLLKYRGGIDIGLENLTPELATKLEESGKGITFSGLETIDKETYEILGRTRGTLRFKALMNITSDEMGELVKKPGGDIYFEKIEEINPAIAEKIVEYPKDIILDGVKQIDKETAEVLGNKNVGRVFLRGLESPLSDDVLQGLSKLSSQNIVTNTDMLVEIYNYKKRKEREGKDLSQIVLDVLDRNINYDELSKLENITYDEAEFLSKSGILYLNLSGVKQIDESIFEVLLKCRGGIDIGLENLTPELATKLEESGKGITFSGLETIDKETYEILGRTRGTLRFKALMNITSDEMGELVKKPGGDIYFEKIEEINPAIAEKIVEYPKDIILDGVKQIDKETAEVLGNKNVGRVFLRGLESPLSDDVLQGLSKLSSYNLSVSGDVKSQIYHYKKQKEVEN